MTDKHARLAWLTATALALACICGGSFAAARSLADFSSRPVFARTPFPLPPTLAKPRSGCLLTERCGQHAARKWLEASHAELQPPSLFSLVVALAPVADSAFGRKWLERTLTSPTTDAGQSQAQLARVQSMAALALAQSGRAGRRALIDAVRREGSVGAIASAALESVGPTDGLMLLQTAGARDAQFLAALERSADLRAFSAVREILRQGDIEVQTRAALLLARQGNEEALELVAHWQNNHLQDVRVLTASSEILLLFDAPSAADAFDALMSIDKQAALKLAARYPKNVIAPSLIAQLEQLPRTSRHQAYAVLGKLRAENAASALARELRLRPSADAAIALAASPAPNAEALLRKAPLTRLSVRAMVVQYYLSLPNRPYVSRDAYLSTTTPVAARELQNRLTAALSEPSLKPTASWALRTLEHMFAKPQWVQSEEWARAQSTPDLRSKLTRKNVRRYLALSELARRGTLNAQASAWLASGDVDIRLAALRGLAQGEGLCGGDRAAKLYQREEQVRVRRTLMAALANCRDTPSVSKLLAVAASLDPDGGVRTAAAQVLAGGALPPPNARGEVVWLELAPCPDCAAHEISLHADDGRVTTARPAEDGTVILLGFPSLGAYARQAPARLRSLQP